MTGLDDLPVLVVVRVVVRLPQVSLQLHQRPGGETVVPARRELQPSLGDKLPQAPLRLGLGQTRATGLPHGVHGGHGERLPLPRVVCHEDLVQEDFEVRHLVLGMDRGELGEGVGRGVAQHPDVLSLGPGLLIDRPPQLKVQRGDVGVQGGHGPVQHVLRHRRPVAVVGEFRDEGA